MCNMLFAILYLFAISCTTDERIDLPSTNKGGDDMAVHLTINTPPVSLPETYTKSQTTQESTIDEIIVLVFKNDKLQYLEEGTITGSDLSTTSFDVTLQSSSSPLKLVLLANINSVINQAGLLPEDSYSSVKSKLQLTFSSTGLNARFPMFGEHDLPSLESTGNNRITGIKMLRSIARADIIVSDDVSNFEMVSIQAYRATNTMQIIPDNVTNMSVTAPSVPDNSNRNVITNEILVNGNKSESQLYLSESVAPLESDRITDATCIIVGGRFDNESVSYYRIDFNLGIDGHPFGQILRNHKYIFNIKKVATAGESSPEEAANKPSASIVTEVQTWDENSTDMWYEGERYFSLSKRTLELRPWAAAFKQSDKIIVNTDLSSYTIQWSDVNGTSVAETSPSETYIENENFIVEIVNNNIIVRAKKNNELDAELKDYFVIHAGKWDIVITINQYGLSKHMDDLIRLLSFDEIGALGNGYSNATTNANAVAMRQILNKQFAPTGIFKFGGYHFTELSRSTTSTSVSSTVLSNFDVVLFPYNQQQSQTLADNVISWLNAKSNRVLILAADATVSNINLLATVGDNLGWSYTTSGGNPNFDFVRNDDTDIFTQNGLFGSIAADSQYGAADAIWGKATNTNNEVTHLLQSPDGNMVVGINKEKRVVYIGDIQIFNNYTNGLSGTTGAISNDRDRFMANLWAWITETVLSGK